jgi:hypothetical protein
VDGSAAVLPDVPGELEQAALALTLLTRLERVAGGSGNQNVLGKNCLNCHGQVHGSNHPSGARLTR